MSHSNEQGPEARRSSWRSPTVLAAIVGVPGALAAAAATVVSALIGAQHNAETTGPPPSLIQNIVTGVQIIGATITGSNVSSGPPEVRAASPAAPPAPAPTPAAPAPSAATPEPVQTAAARAVPEATARSCIGLKRWFEIERIRVEYTTGNEYTLTFVVKNVTKAPVSVHSLHPTALVDDAKNESASWNSEFPSTGNFVPGWADSYYSGGLIVELDEPRPLTYKFRLGKQRGSSVTLRATLLIATAKAGGGAEIHRTILQCDDLPVR